MEYLDLREITKFLDARDHVRIQASGSSMASFESLSEAIVPELTEEDRDRLAEMAMNAFTDGILQGMLGSTLVIETFLRGIDFGREIQRRAG